MVTFISNDILCRYPDIIEEDDSGIRAPHPHLVNLLGQVNARGIHGQADQ